MVGWGEFSEEMAILAAKVPKTPSRPEFVSYTLDQLSVYIPESLDNGGSNIIGYELWADEGNNFSSDFTKITGYGGLTQTYIASSVDGLVIGRNYRFISRSFNIIGFSEFSTESYIAFGDVPFAPAAPTRVKSTETTIKVEWLPPVASEL